MCLSCEDIARQIANQTPEKPLRGSHEKEYLLLIWYKSSDSITLLKAFALSHTAYYVRNFTRHFVRFSWALRHHLMQVALTATILTIEADQNGGLARLQYTTWQPSSLPKQIFSMHIKTSKHMRCKWMLIWKALVCVTSAWSTGLWRLSTSLETG